MKLPLKWISLMKQYESVKIYHGKYLYKIYLTNQLSSLFSSHRQSWYTKGVLSDMQTKHDRGENLTMYRWRRDVRIHPAEFENAKLLQQLFSKYPDCRKRVEHGDRITIYTSNENMVNEIISNLYDCVKEIHRPKEGIEAFFAQNFGTAIVKSPTEYEFRVHLNGHPGIDPSFANWLTSNNDKCKVGEITLRNIQKGDSYRINNCYFYIKNEKVLTMIRMIIGANIRKVERLIYCGDVDKYNYASKQ